MLLSRLRRSWPLAILIVVVLGVIIGGYAYFTAQKLNPTLAVPVRNVLEQSEVGQVVTQVTKPTTTMSTMLTPASASWWNTVNDFVPAWNLSGQWAKLGATKPSSLALVFYNGANRQSKNFFATPALFLQYKDKAAAQSGLKLFLSGDLADANQYQALAVGSTVIVLPVSSFSNVDLRNTTKSLDLQASSSLTKGYWSVNAEVLSKYLTTVQGKANNAFYLKAVKALGFDTSQQNVNWYASSTDGTSWKGQMTVKGSKSDTLWQAVSAKAFYDLLSSSIKKIGYVSPVAGEATANNPQAGTGTTYYIVDPNQSVLSSYFAISQDGATQGKVQTSTTATAKVTAAKGDTVTYTVNPNAWFSLMAYPGANTVYKIFSYTSATLTFNKKDPSLLNIRLSE